MKISFLISLFLQKRIFKRRFLKTYHQNALVKPIWTDQLKDDRSNESEIQNRVNIIYKEMDQLFEERKQQIT